MKFSPIKMNSSSFIRQTMFYVLAVVLLVVLGVVVVYSTAFIIRNSESALDIAVEGAPKQRFDVERYDKLQIIKQRLQR